MGADAGRQVRHHRAPLHGILVPRSEEVQFPVSTNDGGGDGVNWNMKCTYLIRATCPWIYSKAVHRRSVLYVIHTQNHTVRIPS